MQNMAISRCCFVTFCRQWQRNEQRIITQAYTAIALVDVAVKSLASLTNESLADQKDSREFRNHLCSETKSKHKK